MKNFLSILILTISLLFCNLTEAYAFISNEADISNSIQKLYTLRNFDASTLIYKGELIGYRLDNFNQLRLVYNNATDAAIDQLSQIQQNLQNLELNTALTEDLKAIERQRLYENANNIIANYSQEASRFVENARDPLPTITYERFRTKFWNYYNSIGL